MYMLEKLEEAVVMLLDDISIRQFLLNPNKSWKNPSKYVSRIMELKNGYSARNIEKLDGVYQWWGSGFDTVAFSMGEYTRFQDEKNIFEEPYGNETVGDQTRFLLRYIRSLKKTENIPKYLIDTETKIQELDDLRNNLTRTIFNSQGYRAAIDHSKHVDGELLERLDILRRAYRLEELNHADELVSLCDKYVEAFKRVGTLMWMLNHRLQYGHPPSH